MASCSPTDLLASGQCFACLPPGTFGLIKLSLYCRWANGITGPCDIATLLQEASCFQCLTEGQRTIARLVLLCSIVSNPPPPPVCDLATGLVGFWKMEETTGVPRTDSSGNGNDLLDVTASATQEVGKIGFSVGFNGTTQFLRAAGGVVSPSLDLALNDTYTVACWVYLNSLQDAGIIVEIGNGGTRMWALYLQSNRFQFQANGAASAVTANTFGAPPLNTWIFLLAEVNPPAGTVVLTVNNQFTDSLSQAAFQNTVPVQAGVPPIRIGNAVSFFSPSFLNGRVDEARFYKNRLLNPTEQTCLFNFIG